MKLSMWILAEWLEKYSPQVQIRHGHPVLSRVRLLPCGHVQRDGATVCVGLASQLSPDRYQPNQVLCQHSKDWILIDNQSVQLVFNEILAAFDFYNEWESCLREAAYTGASFQTLLDLGYRAFRRPMWIGDWRGKILAMTTEDAPTSWPEYIWPYMISEGYFPVSTWGLLSELPEQLHAIEHGPDVVLLSFSERPGRCLHGTIRQAQDTFIDFQIWEEERKLTVGTMHLAEAFKEVLGIRARSIDIPSEVRPATELFSELLSGGSPDDEAMNRVLFTLRWLGANRWYLVLFRRYRSGKLAERPLLEQLAVDIPHGYCFMWEGEPIMLISCEDWPAAVRTIERLLEDTCFCCGVSMQLSAWRDLSLSLRQAKVALDYGDDRLPVNMCADHAWSYLIHEFGRQVESERLLHPAVGKLEEYDLRNGRELSKTLYEYLRNERHAKLTADRLHLHRNSLCYRLERIADLIDVDLDQADVRMYILLSYRLKEQQESESTGISVES